MAKPYDPLNEVQSDIATGNTWTRGTDTSIVLTDGSDFDAGGGYIRIGDQTSFALMEYTGKTSNTLTGLTACTLGVVVSSGDETKEWPAGTEVSLVFTAEKLNDLQTQLDAVAVPEYARLAPENAIIPASNGAYKQQQDGTNFPYWELAFDKDSDEYAYWRMPVPSNVAAGNWVIKIQWIADAATSGTGLFSCKYLFVADAEAWDDTLTNVDGAAVTTDGTAGNVNTSTITITTPTANAGETLILAIYRDVSGDTLAEDAKLVMGYVDYPV